MMAILKKGVLKMEKIFYNLQTDEVYREDGSYVANSNAPEFVYKTNKTLAVQFLNSDLKNDNGEFIDFYTGWLGKQVACSSCIDDNYTHYTKTMLSTVLTAGMNVNQIRLAGDGYREVGTIKLEDASGNVETVNYYKTKADAQTGTTAFYTANANYNPADFTPGHDYPQDSDATVGEMPIAGVLDSTIDKSDKDTGLLVCDYNLYTRIFQTLVEGKSEIESCKMEVNVYDSADPNNLKLIFSKSFTVRCLGLICDNGEVPPAPIQYFYDKTEIDAMMLNYGAFLNLTDVLISDYTGKDGYALVIDEANGGIDARPLALTDEKVGASALDDNPGYLSDKLDPQRFDQLSPYMITLKAESILNFLIAQNAGIEYSKMEADLDNITIAITQNGVSVIDIPDAVKNAIISAAQNMEIGDLVDVLISNINEGDILIQNAVGKFENYNFSDALAANLKKYMIEAVLTGEISTHSHNFELENGISFPTCEITNNENGKPIVAVYDEDSIIKPDDLISLIHFTEKNISDAEFYPDGYVFKDSANWPNVIKANGSGLIKAIDINGMFSECVLSSQGSSSFIELNLDHDNAPGVNDFSMDCRFSIGAGWVNGDILNFMGIGGLAISLERPDSTTALLRVTLNRITPDDTVELLYDLGDPSIFNYKVNHFMLQRDGGFLRIGYNGQILDNYPLVHNWEIGQITGSFNPHLLGTGNGDGQGVIDEFRYQINSVLFNIENDTYEIPQCSYLIDRYYTIGNFPDNEPGTEYKDVVRVNASAMFVLPTSYEVGDKIKILMDAGGTVRPDYSQYIINSELPSGRLPWGFGFDKKRVELGGWIAFEYVASGQWKLYGHGGEWTLQEASLWIPFDCGRRIFYDTGNDLQAFNELIYNQDFIGDVDVKLRRDTPYDKNTISGLKARFADYCAFLDGAQSIRVYDTKRINIINSIAPGTAAIHEIWIKKTQDVNDFEFIFAHENDPDNRFGFYCHINNTLVLDAFKNGSNLFTYNCSDTLTADGNWHLLTLYRKEDKMAIYKDGVRVGFLTLPDFINIYGRLTLTSNQLDQYHMHGQVRDMIFVGADLYGIDISDANAQLPTRQTPPTWLQIT